MMPTNISWTVMFFAVVVSTFAKMLFKFATLWPSSVSSALAVIAGLVVFWGCLFVWRCFEHLAKAVRETQENKK